MTVTSWLVMKTTKISNNTQMCAQRHGDTVALQQCSSKVRGRLCLAILSFPYRSQRPTQRYQGLRSHLRLIAHVEIHQRRQRVGLSFSSHPPWGS